MVDARTSMPEESNEDLYEEEWVVKVMKSGEYRLSKKQAWILQDAIARNEKSIIMFKTFSISLSYVVEFYRVKRFMKASHQLTAQQIEDAWTEKDRLNAIERIKKLKEKLHENM